MALLNYTNSQKVMRTMAWFRVFAVVATVHRSTAWFVEPKLVCDYRFLAGDIEDSFALEGKKQGVSEICWVRFPCVHREAQHQQADASATMRV